MATFSPFTKNKNDSVSALGELKLIDAIARWLGDTTPNPPHGIGDDCAVLPPSNRRQLVTVDPVVYGEHFNDKMPPNAAGEKLLKRNLSDIAAMGGRPRAAVISLAMDSGVKTKWLEKFYKSIAKVARQHAVPIVGGDITHMKGGIVATLTLVGEASGKRILARTGARRGDLIYVTGKLGGSILGKHWKFQPRLKEGEWLARQTAVKSLMDISDGIAKDAHALRPENCLAAIDPERVPISAAARTLSRRDKLPPLAHALGDGEDYELLFTLDGRADAAKFEAAWRRQFADLPLTRIGLFADKLPSGFVNLKNYKGYEHLR